MYAHLEAKKKWVEHYLLYTKVKPVMASPSSVCSNTPLPSFWHMFRQRWEQSESVFQGFSAVLGRKGMSLYEDNAVTHYSAL